VLGVVGGTLATPVGIGTAAYRLDRAYIDRDADGIPDSLERSAEFDAWLRRVFKTVPFEGLDPNRRDLLVDVRYVGETKVSAKTKSLLVELFRDNGIYLQWLDHPTRYDKTAFEKRYGYNVRRILWSPRSFYHRTVDRRLKNVAFQLFVVPGLSETRYHGKLYSPSTASYDRSSTGYVNGFNTGNRAVVAERRDHETEAKLILHEIAHYALCHSTDPANTGVMGTKAEVDLLADEWAALRSGLGAIRDTTGVDVAFRRCLWGELDPSWGAVPDAVTSVGCDGCRAD